MCPLSENARIVCFVGDDVFLVLLGLVSIIDEIVSVFPTGAEQTCGKTRRMHFGPKFEINFHGIS